METVYVVFGPVFRSVVGVFSTHEQAEAVISTLPVQANYRIDYWVEELPLDSAWEQAFVTVVRMSRDGRVVQTYERMRDTRGDGFQAFDVDGNLVWAVVGRDPIAAANIVEEERVRILSENTWGQRPKSVIPKGDRFETLRTAK